MKIISRNLAFIAVAMLTLFIGTAAISVFGQGDTKLKNKAEHKVKDRGFCTNNNWTTDDHVSFNELRETTIPASGSVTVDGRQNGGIHVIGEERSDVLVRSCIQTWAKTDEEAKSLASSIKIETGGTIKADDASETNHWSVSYEVHVPRSTNLDLTAHNGGIAISGVDGNAEFETMNGGLSLNNVAGNFKGRTTNGGVNVSLSGGSWKGSGLDVTTTNGGVNLTLPTSYAAHVETGTVNGGFSSDIPSLNVTTEDVRGDRSGHYRNRRVETNLNGGGPTIRVITTNGGVRINSGEIKE